MSKILNGKIARTAEEYAAEYVANNGYKVLHRNWRRPDCEIDIIARNRRTGSIHFFEVKYRHSVVCGGGIAAVDETKIRRLKRAVVRYGLEHPTDDVYEIGVIALNGDGSGIDYFNEALDL